MFRISTLNRILKYFIAVDLIYNLTLYVTYLYIELIYNLTSLYNRKLLFSMRVIKWLGSGYNIDRREFWTVPSSNI